MAKRFFYVATGMVLLALAYNLGASTATAQASGDSFVGITSEGLAGVGGNLTAITANGDVYMNSDTPTRWTYYGNIRAGATPTETGTWGQLKARYR